MRILVFIIAAVALLILFLMAYVRLAPVDIARWHQTREVTGPGDTTRPASFEAVRRMTAPADQVLAAVAQQAMTTPRTILLAGSIEEGMMTYQTRSLLWGFPDYTTVSVQDDLLVLFGRARFGRSDMGVNKARISTWLEALGPLTGPP